MTLQTASNGAGLPDMSVSVRQVFGIDSDLEVPAYSRPDEHVPDIDPDYLFNREVTLAILAGFAHNRRVMVQGRHGTGKSSHVEQVASRLNWPCVRVNLDGHVSRMDLIGKDAIVIRDGQQVSFRIGINSGSMIAGVIGRRKFVYDVWGDAVNVASRMESHGLGGAVQITQATYELIEDEFECKRRGTVTVKGKGEMEVWLVVSERGIS